MISELKLHQKQYAQAGFCVSTCTENYTFTILNTVVASKGNKKRKMKKTDKHQPWTQ